MNGVRLAALLLWLLAALVPYAPAFAQAVVVGGKDFTEQRLIAELTGQLLRARGFRVETRVGFSTSGIRQEQELGLIDLYWEYTGTSLVTFNRVADKLDPAAAYARVKGLDARRGLTWLAPSRVDNTYALAMRRSDAEAAGIASISDLAIRMRAGQRIRLACNTEFFIRPDGLLPLQRSYRFELEPADVIRMDTDRVYDALHRSRDVDVGLVFSTDGRVAAFDFLLLRDDRAFFPGYLLAPVIRRDTLERHPDLAGPLNALSAQLDSATMASLNAQVDLHGKAIEEVASSFLRASNQL